MGAMPLNICCGALETLKPHEQVAVTVYTSCIPEHVQHVYVKILNVYAKHFGSMMYMHLHLIENVSFLVWGYKALALRLCMCHPFCEVMYWSAI